jgi:nitric oxide reductase subunit B
MPILRGRPYGNREKAQNVELKAFWMMNIGMIGLTLALSAAGLVQIFDQRVGTDLISFMDSQESINGIYMVRLGFGLLVFTGLLTYIYSFFVKEPSAESARA